MSNKFLNAGASLSTSLDPNSSVKTDSAGNLRASKLVVSDTTGLQALLDAKITEPPKLAGNNGRYLKYNHGGSVSWDTPAGGSGGGSSTYLGLSDTPSTHSANALLYSTGTSVEHTTTQIAIDGGGVSVNQLNARVNNSSNIGDSSHRFNDVHCNSLHQGNVKLVLPTSRGTAGQLLSLASASNEVHTLGFTDIISDSSASTSTTYSSNKINTELATKAAASHQHAIADVTNLQSSLDAKLNSSQIVNSASTTANQAYDVRYVDSQLATKAPLNHTHAISDITNLQTSLDSKLDASRIQTAAEGDSTSETDTYSCNSVYSKAQINTSVTSQEITVNHPSTAGRLNFGSNMTSGLYGSLQTYANGTRYSAMHHYATSGNCNLEWYLMKSNGLTKMITVRPNDSEKVFEVLDGGIKCPIFQQRDSTTIIKIGRMDSASLGVPGMAIIPLVNTVNSEIQMRGLRNTGILGDTYVYHQNGSTLTIQSRIQTNRHSSTHSNIEISTYQGGAETKVLDIGSNGTSKTVTVTGTLHATSHITTAAASFTANDQVVTKGYVDQQVANLIDSAPGALDTLNELAAAMGDDANFSTTVTNSIATKLALSGGNLTGNVTTSLANSDFTPTSLVSRNYVDNQVAGNAGSTTFTALTDTPSVFTNDRFLKTTGSAVVDFELNSKTLAWTFYNQLSDLPTASTVHGQIAHVHAEGAVYFSHNSSWVKLANDSRVDNSVSNIALSGSDLSVTRQDGSAFLVTGVKPPALSWAVQGGTVSNNGATLQLTQTNGSPAAITGLTPSTVADGKTLASGAYDLGAGNIAITQQDTTSITISGCPRPLSSFSAGAGSGNYYTPSFLNDRILPAVSSAVNTRLLGNDGTGALWLSTLTAGSTTMNVGTSTIKKFATWATGAFQEYFMKSSPSNGDALGSLVYSDTSFNNYASISCKVDDTSNRAGHISISTAWNNTPAETLLIGKSDHSGSDAGQFKGVLKADGIKFSSNLTQTKPVEDPSTVGHVLTSTPGGNWQWAAPSGGGTTTYPKIDARSLSGGNLTLQNTDGTTSTISAKNILWGNRAGNYIIENTLIARRYNTTGGTSLPTNGILDPNLLGHHNGYRANPDTKNDIWFPFGHVKYSFRQNYQMRYNAFYIFSFYSTAADITLGIYASNDGINWDELKTFDYDDTSAWTNGYSSSTQTLGGVSITFPARSGSDVGLPHTTNANFCRRYTFANNNYYTMYMLKWIGWGTTDYQYLSDTTWTTDIISTGHEFEWG